MMKRLSVLAVLAMGMAMVASAEVITFQDGVSPTPAYAGTADAHIISWDGSQNQTKRLADGRSDPGTAGGGNPQNAGLNEYIEEGDYNANGGQLDSKVILISFDISSIAKSRAKDVASAKLGLYYVYERATAGDSSNNSKPGPVATVLKGRSNAHYVQAQKILKKWAEGKGGGAAAGGVDGADTPDNSGGVTWNSTGYEIWEAIGAEGPTDVAMPESSTWFKPTPFSWLYIDVTKMTRDWVADPATNFGVKISQETDNDPNVQAGLPSTADPKLGAMYVGGAYDFASRNNADAPHRPKLIVELLQSSSAGEDWSLYR
jgi:hypothetical protein